MLLFETDKKGRVVNCGVGVRRDRKGLHYVYHMLVASPYAY